MRAPRRSDVHLPVISTPGRRSSVLKPRAPLPAVPNGVRTADWAPMLAEAREHAARLRPHLNRPASGLREHRRRLHAYQTAAHNYLQNLRLEWGGRHDLRPLYFVWTLLRSCNFRCTYCDDHTGRRYPDMSNRGVLDTRRAFELLRIMRTATPSVYFAGGEPMLRKDLPLITRRARELDYYPIVINTNASLVHERLTRPNWKSWLADTDIVVVSLDALDPAVLHEMWRTRRPEVVIRNLLLLRELRTEMRFKLMVNTVIQPGATKHARQVLDLARALDIWFCPVPMNTGPAIAPALLSDPEYIALANLILNRKREGQRISGSERMNERLLFARTTQCRNTLKPHIDFDGTLMWPCKASVNVEPVRINVLDFEDVESVYDYATRLIDPTGFQGPGPDQCGAACNWAQNYSTDAYRHGLLRPGRLVRDMARFLRHR